MRGYNYIDLKDFIHSKVQMQKLMTLNCAAKNSAIINCSLVFLVTETHKLPKFQF